MTEKFTALEWSIMEGGHSVDEQKEENFSFIKDIHESRMTKTDGSASKLTYTDCMERAYLTLLALETMRQFPDFLGYVQRYAKKTAGFETYRYYRLMGTDLYNFLYFIAGDDSAQKKLKDPDAAIKLKKSINIPIKDINRYINAIRSGQPTQVSNMFIRVENAFSISNSDYKTIRRGLTNWDTLTRAERRLLVTRLIFAVRAKLRSSDIIEDFEKFAAVKDLEKANVQDPEPTISVPDISTAPADIALYRYLVGAKNMALTKRFLEKAKNGQAISGIEAQAYLPAIELLDDIVQGGPGFIQNLRALRQRAKKQR